MYLPQMVLGRNLLVVPQSIWNWSGQVVREAVARVQAAQNLVVVQAEEGQSPVAFMMPAHCLQLLL
tara:strand:- start:529 stop:726 length:198 start_codon:yes stop_codon:yes gene_type:complete